MAGRGRSTFQKRKKEQTRLERRQQKVARKIERKAEKDNPQAESELESLELGPFPSEEDLGLPTETSSEPESLELDSAQGEAPLGLPTETSPEDSLAAGGAAGEGRELKFEVGLAGKQPDAV